MLLDGWPFAWHGRGWTVSGQKWCCLGHGRRMDGQKQSVANISPKSTVWMPTWTNFHGVFALSHLHFLRYQGFVQSLEASVLASFYNQNGVGDIEVAGKATYLLKWGKNIYIILSRGWFSGSLGLLWKHLFEELYMYVHVCPITWNSELFEAFHAIPVRESLNKPIWLSIENRTLRINRRTAYPKQYPEPICSFQFKTWCKKNGSAPNDVFSWTQIFNGCYACSASAGESPTIQTCAGRSDGRPLVQHPGPATLMR